MFVCDAINMLFLPEDKMMKDQKKKISTFEYGCRIYRLYPLQMCIITVLLIIASFLEIVSIVSVMPLLQILLQGEEITGGVIGRAISLVGMNTMPLHSLLLVVVFLVCATELLLYVKDILLAFLSTSIEKQFKNDLMEAVLYAGWRFQLGERVGNIVNIIFNETLRVSSSIMYLGKFYSSIVVALVFMCVSFAVSSPAVVFGCVLAGLMMFLVKRLASLTRMAGSKAVAAGNACNEALVENMTVNKFVKAGHHEAKRYEMFEGITKSLAEVRYAVENYKAIMAHYSRAFSAICICGIFFIYTKYFPQASLDLIVVLILLNRTYARISKVQSTYRGVQFNIPSYEACERLLQKSQKNREKVGALGVQGIKNDVMFNDVSFCYQSGEKILSGITLQMHAKQMIAFVGSSGAGKTTILDLLLGLIDPDSGSIVIDGIDMNNLDLYSWRKQIGYVPQEPVLLNASIRDNISMGDQNISFENIKQAAKLAHADEFIARQEKGFDSLVGDRGIKLSGGEKQRIALARALVRNPSIFILDEATSALDNESEAKIQDTILSLKGHMTIFIVAHRLSTVEKADCIHVLHNGKIVESGTASELKGKEGVFRKLYGLYS